MTNCNAVQAKFSEYLDGRLTGRDMQHIAAHLGGCEACAGEWAELKKNQASLAALGSVPEPKDLVLRIRVAVSRERARTHKSAWAGFGLAWKNSFGPFILQAMAGFASAVLLLGSVTVLVGMFTRPEAAQATKDVPLGNATAPRLLYYATTGDDIGATAGPLIVEAYVNSEGAVYDYRIVSGPKDPATRAQVENILLSSVFEPARFFGQPVRGLAVLAFSGISVRG